VLKVQLEEAKIERQHKEECEAIRRLIAAQPPQQHLNDFEKEVVG
jgi:THO complex subunit 7